MNDAELKDLKAKLKEQTKNDLVRLLLKSATLVDMYKQISENLSENIKKLKEELNVLKGEVK